MNSPLLRGSRGGPLRPPANVRTSYGVGTVPYKFYSISVRGHRGRHLSVLENLCYVSRETCSALKFTQTANSRSHCSRMSLTLHSPTFLPCNAALEIYTDRLFAFAPSVLRRSTHKNHKNTGLYIKKRFTDPFFYGKLVSIKELYIFLHHKRQERTQ